MEANTRSPRDLFEGKEHYEVPAFQRPYVWNEEDQWAPLWEDVVRVAESYVAAKERGVEVDPHHFLGAVVYESKPPVAGDVTRHDVIDGQQRMTTLQLLIDAAYRVLTEGGHSLMAEGLEDLVYNRSMAFKGKRERFKLWPSQTDRAAFARTMDPHAADQLDHRIGEAHAFFLQEARRWVTGQPDSDGALPPGDEPMRAEALSSTLQDRLLLVVIDLTGHDDSQLIFETLNDRGTPLLKADLIKNWVFRQGESAGVDINRWAETHWSDFDSTWWREEITQGRLVRSRVDIFLQYWLTMRRQEEVKAEHVFRVFAEYAKSYMAGAATAEGLLLALRKDADTYRSFAQLDGSSIEGRFYSRVLDTMELAATTPVFLWLLSENHKVPADQLRIGLEAIESWVIRRTLMRLTTKDVNKFMVAILKVLSETPPGNVGARIVAFLSEQTAETRYWPSDAQLLAAVPNMKLYGNIRQGRLRVVLSAVEQHLRNQSTMYEAVALPSALEVEHIMPQGWRTHWDNEPPLTPTEAAERDRLVNSLGNLTLVTKSLNGSLSNRPWTDSQAIGLKDGGEPSKGKRTLLSSFSLLVLNKRVVDDHPYEWTEEDIAMRSREVSNAITRIWPRPDPDGKWAPTPTLSSTEPAVLPEIEWTKTDIRRLANEAGETLLLVLDTLASNPNTRWSNRDFVDAGLTMHAFAALGALTMKARGSFGRSNPPISYEQNDGTWTWAFPEPLAEAWRSARGL